MALAEDLLVGCAVGMADLSLPGPLSWRGSFCGFHQMWEPGWAGGGDLTHQGQREQISSETVWTRAGLGQVAP
jgi:hypothetical protein